MSKFLSQRKYAEHRGVTLRAVQKAIQMGRIALSSNKKLDVEACDIAWELATDPRKQRDSGERKKVVPRRVRKNAEKFAEARASSEDYKAKFARLKFEQQLGKLVDAEVVRKRAFEQGRALREAILNLPNQIGVELAGETDAAKLISMLERELTRCLEEVSAPRLEAAAASLSPLGSDPGPDHEELELEDEDELEGLPVERPR